MKGQLRIESMYAYVVVDTDNTEGIPAMHSMNAGVLTALPLVGADMVKVDQLRPIAQQIADQLGKPIEIVHFENRIHIGWINPGGQQ